MVMELFTALLFVCGLPLAIFWAGWTACYFLVVKYRFRVETRFEEQPPRNATKQQGWQP
jgi:hypothetical protein